AKLAFFYVPPKDGTSVNTIASSTDFMILNGDKQSYHQELLDHGYSGDVIQYMLASEVAGPGPYRNSSSSCDSNYQSLQNNVAKGRGDFCRYVHQNESWFLHNGKGERLYSTRGSRVYYHMNPASSGWRSFARSRMEADLNENGFDGFFLDNVSLSITKVQKQLNNSDYVVKEFSSDSSYRSAWTGYLSYLSGKLRTNGHVVWANLIADPNEGDSWDAYLSYLDGGMNEAWATGYGSSGLDVDKWENNLVQTERALQSGKGVIALAQGSRWDNSRQRFHLASYFLVSHPDKPLYLRYAKDGDYDEFWWYSNYETALGAPLGSRYKSGSSWKRDFQCGSVTVNPASRSASISTTTCSSSGSGGSESGSGVEVSGLADGQTVSGSITVEARPSASSVENVRFYLDGGFVWQEGQAPYYLGGDENGNPYGFDTGEWSGGGHTLRVVVTYSNGSTDSKEIDFSVSSGSSQSGSGPVINGLSSGQTVSGSITVEAVPPSGSIEHVRFYIDGDFVWHEGHAPYYLGGDVGGTPLGYSVSGLTTGQHRLRVEVQTSDGATSGTEVDFVVADTSGISLAGIADSQTVSGTITVEAIPSSTSVEQVRFYLDGEYVWHEGNAPYFLGGDANGRPDGFNSRSWGNGWHELSAEVTYKDGTSDSVTISIRVSN
ncbi:MAG: putative glycoside hydrolase, partial [Thermomicrobiales bacterium]